VAKPFKSRKEIDRWYQEVTSGLAQALVFEMETLGLARFNEYKRLRDYEYAIGAITNVTQNLYDHLRLSPTTLKTVDDLLNTLSCEQVLSKTTRRRSR
jgi:hypothetical protein